MGKYSVSLEKFISDLHLTPMYLPDNASKMSITTSDVNRTGLLLSGYKEHLEPERVQVCGMTEISYLNHRDKQARMKGIDLLIRECHPPAVVVTRGNTVPEEMLELAKECEVPILTTSESTSRFLSDAISFLNVELAPRITRHGVLVEVYGEGILINGESGIGKSETAIELVKRGHRLVADDAVELRKVSNRTIVGQAPENIRHFVELRGIGIINVRRIFGMGSVKVSERVDLIINLEHWVVGKNYNRVGLDDESTEILDVDIPTITIPVQPGRNLAILLEVAAMNNRQKKMGYNSANELMKLLGLETDNSLFGV